MFDRATIDIRAGAGGNGCLSFRREAHVPKGGPDGGDGGRGGDVIVRCDDSLRDLQAFRRHARFSADRGGHGEGNLRHGRDGEPTIISVPPGTEVLRWDGTRYDLVAPGQEVRVAGGGSGGRGNKRFAGPTRQAPRLAERGLPGDEGVLELRLKLLADVGLVGLPNAGKSSLLARITRAAPKVGAYPFTTLEPVLGTLHEDDRQLVIADIPGLIEGASAGAGLGHDFLAHVERTRLLVHLVELAPLDGSSPEANFATIERELALHDPRLASLPRLVALSKADLVSPEAGEAARVEWAARVEHPVLLISSATGQGLDALARELLRRVPLVSVREAAAGVGGGDGAGPGAGAGGGAGAAAGAGAGESGVAEYRVFRPAAAREWTVQRTGRAEGRTQWRVAGPAVDRLVARYDLEQEDALSHMEGRLRGMGVIAALEAEGFEPGDDVEIGGIVFELDPGAPI